LTDIHQTYLNSSNATQELNPIVLDPTIAESFLEGGGDLTGDKIKEMPLDSFIGMLRCLAETKIEEFIKFIES